MSKFKRVGDAEQLPSFVKQAFFEDTQTIERDPYAGLKSEAESYQTRMAEKTLDVKENAPSPWTQSLQDWKSKNEPNIYNQEEASNFNPLMNSNSVRRSSFASDNGLNARDTDKTFFMTEEQAIDMQMSGRSGCSIWHPFFSDMKNITTAAAEREGMFEKRSKDDIRREKEEIWEKDHLAALNRQVRPRAVMASRSYISQPNYSQTSTNSFGFLTPEDYAALDTDEQVRRNREVEAKFESKRLKRADLSNEERRATWEHRQAATTYQDVDAAWADNILGSYGGR